MTIHQTGLLQEMTLADQVFYKIQNAIINGDLAPGSKISEPELSRIHGISRGPLREAIHRLEGQKLVERTAHVGARVVSLSHQQLSELYQIRENLEGLACRLAAQRIDKQQILALRDVLKKHAEDKTFKAGEGYYKQEGQDDFHYCIIKNSGNKTLEKMLCDELYHLIRMYRIQFSNTPNRPPKALNEHIRILDAIADGDGELAELLMRRHIAQSYKNIEQHWMSSQGE
ncbi:GntR family transcriptional regulator [Acinetobacter qingfengensis]|uniref:GntR family transcriptional regulator n=1 Tax=Acinetobacter qingfengensis TaxID=1262585 RepID=A0A1E7R945_9GAMM|nr:GntR family transcriptional regulator [Acinetobacter qingfengensis]KAA8735477.1 GntR family transcriptional regulator [Acinetobacter qingfengensis]OEY95880.1 GntR family transcriptional regulator [Acinetobacter qingfengensis]